ncbi:MAG: hypothetical protein PHP01_09030, partial [Phycisphaerae bacterium]|nr:hypothetical protein [Phycisphaerae bacterium]
ICVPSNVCGCAGFLDKITGHDDCRNVIVADYTDLDDMKFDDIDEILKIDMNVRNKIERHVSERVALEIFARLPKNDDEIVEMINSGYDLAEHMGWEVVVEQYVLKAFSNAVERQKLKTAV